MIGCTGRPATRVSNTFVEEINKRLGDLQKSPPPGDAKQKRNEAIEYVVATFDANYEEFVRDLQAKRSRADFIADVIEIGTSAAIGITKGSQRTIQIMGIALTAFRGGRKSAELNFFKEQTTAVLITKMDDGRAQIYAGMLTKMRDQDINQYPVFSAVRDLVAYYNAGTLVRAFMQLSKDTAVQARKSEDKVQTLKAFRNLSVSARDILTDLEKDLKGSDDAKKAAATTRLQNIIAALEQDDEAAAALKKSNVSSKDTDGVKLEAALVAIRRSAAIANNNALLDTINQAIEDTKK
jgi:hypothetical protein